MPFNGTDDSGWARCYGYIGLAESATIESARWQEAGGYNSSCGPFAFDDFPVSGQVRCNLQQSRVSWGLSKANYWLTSGFDALQAD